MQPWDGDPSRYPRGRLRKDRTVLRSESGLTFAEIVALVASRRHGRSISPSRQRTMHFGETFGRHSPKVRSPGTKGWPGVFHGFAMMPLGLRA